MKRIIYISFLAALATLTIAGCSDIDSEIDDLKKEIAALNERVLAVEESSVKEIEQRISAVKEEISRLQESDKVQRADITALQKEVSGISDDIAKLRESISALEEDESGLSARIEEINSKIDAMDAEIASIISGISALEKRVESVYNAVRLTYIQRYGDKTEKVRYKRDTLEILGSLELMFQVQPESAAESLAKDSLFLLSAKAVYAFTKAEGGESVKLNIIDASAENGILTLNISPDGLGKDFILGNMDASVAILGSYGDEPIATDYIGLTSVVEEKKLVSYLLTTFDTDGDGHLDNMDKVTSFNVSGLGLTYIDDMLCKLPSLKELNCSNNSLEVLDLSSNPSLTTLNISGNSSLRQLDISNNTALKSLNASSLKSLRSVSLNLSKNTALTTLDISESAVTALDVESNAALTTLNISNCGFTALYVSKNTALTTLNVSGTSISSLDLSKNTALSSLNLSKVTALTALDISNTALKTVDVTTNTALTSIKASKSALTSLNLTKNTALTSLDLSKSTSLVSLDLSKNTALTAVDISGASALATLDVSKNTALTVLNVSEAASLSTLKVSSTVKLVISTGLNSSIYQIGQYISLNNIAGVVFRTSSPAAISTDETTAKWEAADSWCPGSHGSDWRLPNVEELKTMFGKFSVLNKTLSAIGGTELNSKEHYWSSVYDFDEDEFHAYYAVRYPGGAYDSDSYEKSTKYRVRAFRLL